MNNNILIQLNYCQSTIWHCSFFVGQARLWAECTLDFYTVCTND